MNAQTAANIAALRPALDSLIVKATVEPEGIQEPSPQDSDLMNVIRAISKINSASYGVEPPAQSER
jgi:ATP-dependent RNA helicase A